MARPGGLVVTVTPGGPLKCAVTVRGRSTSVASGLRVLVVSPLQLWNWYPGFAVAVIPTQPAMQPSSRGTCVEMLPASGKSTTSVNLYLTLK
jgi:predicted S18 family serine protease